MIQHASCNTTQPTVIAIQWDKKAVIPYQFESTLNLNSTQLTQNALRGDALTVIPPLEKPPQLIS